MSQAPKRAQAAWATESPYGQKSPARLSLRRYSETKAQMPPLRITLALHLDCRLRGSRFGYLSGLCDVGWMASFATLR